MKIKELKHNEQTGDLAIVFSGGRATMTAKALDVRCDNERRVTYALLDRLIPNFERLESDLYQVSGAFVSEVSMS